MELYFKNSKEILPWFSILAFVASGAHAIANVYAKQYLFGGMIEVGGIVNIFFFIFTFGAALLTLLSIDYIKKYGTYFGEYYILLQSSVLGMMLMACAKDLLVIFLGLEIMSVCFYALAGMNRSRLKAVEASLKYFLLGAFTTGFIVYGIALIYGAAQTTSIDGIVEKLPYLSKNLLFLTGLLLFIIGFSFKIAAFPFHMWVPDVYQGASTTVAGLFSTGGKAGAFSAIIAAFSLILVKGNFVAFMPYLAVVSLFSMFYGSIVAISQKNIKRMLAYSSISHAGYIIIGLASANSDGISAIVFYLLSYTFMNLAAFGLVALIEGNNETNLEISDLSGLGQNKPLLAALMAVAMFSLAGIPPFSGFFSKYYIFIAAVKADLTWLAVLGVLSSLISVYFYIRIIIIMYFKPAEGSIIITKSNSGLIAVIIAVICIIVLGIFPGSFLSLITPVF
ncbi:MAG: NADH-quinone oxidoreductase subunit N [Bacteroidota bacterium]|nr:NADH-quinone oxidoreductase subunit N [Bacteroidota bacterium]